MLMTSIDNYAIEGTNGFDVVNIEEALRTKSNSFDDTNHFLSFRTNCPKETANCICKRPPFITIRFV